jgi:hypothetical protein
MVKNTGRWDVFYSCPGSGKTTAALMVLQKLRKIIRGGPLGMMVIGVLKNSQSSYAHHKADSLSGANSTVDTDELVVSLASALSCGLDEPRMASILILDNFELVDHKNAGFESSKPRAHLSPCFLA